MSNVVVRRSTAEPPPLDVAGSPGLRLEQHDAAVHLVLDRTDKANAFTQAMWDALPSLVSQAEGLPGARVLVLRSASTRVFCAGADVAEYSANAGDVAWGQANHVRVATATDALHACTLATVAAIAGPCAGAGVALATACDLRIATQDAVFAVPPTRLGLVYPQSDTARLVDLVGAGAARWMLLSAARVDAAWALRTGLVEQLVAADELDAAVASLVEAIAAGAPVSVRAMKQTVDLALGGLRTENDVTRALLAEALEHPDHEEGTAAFLARRPPQFG